MAFSFLALYKLKLKFTFNSEFVVKMLYVLRSYSLENNICPSSNSNKSI